MSSRVSLVALLVVSAGCGPSSSGGAQARSQPKPVVVVPAPNEPEPGEVVPSEQNEPRGDKRFSLGERAETLGYAVLVESVKECKPSYYFSKPKTGNIWLGVELVVESISDEQIWANPAHAKLLDVAGAAYSYSFIATTDCDPGLRAGQLNKNEKAMGWVVFEIPEDASGLRLVYDPIHPGPPQPVTFDLGR